MTRDENVLAALMIANAVKNSPEIITGDPEALARYAQNVSSALLHLADYINALADEVPSAVYAGEGRIHETKANNLKVGQELYTRDV